MSIARTARGTSSGASSNASLSSVTCAGGSTLVVGIMWGDSNSILLTGMTWNGVALAQIFQGGGTTNGDMLEVWAAYAVPAGTATVNVTATSSPLNQWAMIATEISGASASPLDKTHTGTGTGTAPSSGATATTAQANEALLGFVGTEGPSSDANGTWQNSFTNGQRIGTSSGAQATINEGFRLVTATGAYTASKTGITSRDWNAGILTLKEGDVSQPSSTGASGGIGTASLILGGVISVVASVGALGGIGACTPIIGPRTIVADSVIVFADSTTPTSGTAVQISLPDSVGIESGGGTEDGDVGALAGVGSVVFVQTGERNPDAITSQDFVVVRAQTPAGLGDGSYNSTGKEGVSLGPGSINPAGDTIDIVASTMQDLVSTAVGTIDHVNFMMMVYQQDNTNPTRAQVNPRAVYTLGGNTVATTATVEATEFGGVPFFRDNDGIDTGDFVDQYGPAGYLVHLDNVTTKPGGGAWTVDDINALTNVGLRVSYPAAWEFFDVWVVEVWIEVYGVIGNVPSVIGQKGHFGNVLLQEGFTKENLRQSFDPIAGSGGMGKIVKRVKVGG